MSDTSSANTDADAQGSHVLRAAHAARDSAPEKLLERVRPWALRQAARSYGHLPDDDRFAAVDAALGDLRARGVADDPRAARTAIADDLTARLRSAHVAWCNRPSAVDAPPPRTPEAPGTVADVVERGLKGLERAVLQLEIGAGRDTRTARAALRLGPRDYSRHRREGLAKLRAAISGQVGGHVCDAHAGDVVLAATGDDTALERLGAGPHRCRSCSREAQGLRRLLHQRLGLAPWPLTVKPMGVLAAKLAGLGAAAGGTGLATGGGGAAGLATGLAAGVVGVTALGGGAWLVADRAQNERPAPAAAERSVAPAPAQPAAVARASSVTTASAQGDRPRPRPVARVSAAERPARAPQPQAVAPTTRPAASEPPAAATAPAVAAATPAPAPAPSLAGSATRPVTDTVREATKPVTEVLPPPVAAPVQETVDGVAGTVDGVAGTVDGVTGTVQATADGLTRTGPVADVGAALSGFPAP